MIINHYFHLINHDYYLFNYYFLCSNLQKTLEELQGYQKQQELWLQHQQKLLSEQAPPSVIKCLILNKNFNLITYFYFRPGVTRAAIALPRV